LLLFLPLLGGVAYLVIELLPEFSGSIRGQRTVRQVREAVNPLGTLKAHADAWAQSPNTDNARRYAQALIDQQKYEDAEQVLEQALSGLFATEPGLMLLQAKARFESGDPAGSVQVLEALNTANPDFRSAEGHLLYAKSLESAGRLPEAVQQYREVATYYPGAEARFWLALALGESGQTGPMMEELEQMLADARLAPAHFRKSQKKWLNLAKSKLNQSRESGQL